MNFSAKKTATEALVSNGSEPVLVPSSKAGVSDLLNKREMNRGKASGMRSQGDDMEGDLILFSSGELLADKMVESASEGEESDGDESGGNSPRRNSGEGSPMSLSNSPTEEEVVVESFSAKRFITTDIKEKSKTVSRKLEFDPQVPLVGSRVGTSTNEKMLEVANRGGYMSRIEPAIQGSNENYTVEDTGLKLEEELLKVKLQRSELEKRYLEGLREITKHYGSLISEEIRKLDAAMASDAPDLEAEDRLNLVLALLGQKPKENKLSRRAEDVFLDLTIRTEVKALTDALEKEFPEMDREVLLCPVAQVAVYVRYKSLREEGRRIYKCLLPEQQAIAGRAVDLVHEITRQLPFSRSIVSVGSKQQTEPPVKIPNKTSPKKGNCIIS